jgi:hypothetical protein
MQEPAYYFEPSAHFGHVTYAPEFRAHPGHGLRAPDMYPVPEVYHQSRHLMDMSYSASQRPHIERLYLSAAAAPLSRMQSTQLPPDEVSDVPIPASSRASAESKYASSYNSTLFVPVAPSRERSVVSSGATENGAQQGLQALGLDLYQPNTPRDASFRFPSAGVFCVCLCECMYMYARIYANQSTSLQSLG